MYRTSLTSAGRPRGRAPRDENIPCNDFSHGLTALIRDTPILPVPHRLEMLSAEIVPENVRFANTLSLLKARASHTNAQHICLRRVFLNAPVEPFIWMYSERVVLYFELAGA